MTALILIPQKGKKCDLSRLNLFLIHVHKFFICQNKFVRLDYIIFVDK